MADEILHRPGREAAVGEVREPWTVEDRFDDGALLGEAPVLVEVPRSPVVIPRPIVVVGAVAVPEAVRGGGDEAGHGELSVLRDTERLRARPGA